jgi:hypothetical protein
MRESETVPVVVSKMDLIHHMVPLAIQQLVVTLLYNSVLRVRLLHIVGKDIGTHSLLPGICTVSGCIDIYLLYDPASHDRMQYHLEEGNLGIRI